MTTSAQIIERIFGSPDRTPVFDRTAYSIPVEFWRNVESEIEIYKLTDLQYTTFSSLIDLAKEYDFYNSFLKECGLFLHLGPDDVDKFIEHFNTHDIAGLNDHLLNFFCENKLKLAADLIDTRRKQRLGMKKRDIVRRAYREYEEKRTTDAFIIERDQLEFPDLMIDRFVWMIYADGHMAYKKDVKNIIIDNRDDFNYMILTDRAEYSKRDYQAANYTDEEIDMFVPHNLEDEFNLIKNRSVLDNFTLTTKPKKVRDGSGWSYLWKTDGMTYRFNYDPPQGRAVSLMILANMQRLVWQEVINNEPNREELEEIYNNEFLKESNFVPTGYEHLYQKYESNTFFNLISKSVKTYHTMMRSAGFDKIDKSTLIAKALQVEVCWNKQMPIDLGSHLWHRYDSLRKIGLHPELNAKTPLLHTKFPSDIDTGFIRFDHKEYRKSKKVFRNEIVFMSELKNTVNLGKISSRKKSGTIGDYLLDDLELTKQYLYYKLHRRYNQINGLKNDLGGVVPHHGYYDWRNSPVTIKQGYIRSTLKGLLNSQKDLPDWLKDIQLFDVLVDQEFLDRKFFRNLTEKEYRIRVNNDPLFQKIGHGRYRLNHPAVKEYRKVRSALTTDPEPVGISQS